MVKKLASKKTNNQKNGGNGAENTKTASREEFEKEQDVRENKSLLEIVSLIISACLVFGIVYLVSDSESSRRLQPSYRKLNN